MSYEHPATTKKTFKKTSKLVSDDDLWGLTKENLDRYAKFGQYCNIYYDFRTHSFLGISKYLVDEYKINKRNAEIMSQCDGIWTM